MERKKSPSVGHLQEVARFEAFKVKLLTKAYALHLKKPLNHWAVLSDKRLPLALMGRTLGEIIHTPFDEIANTSGVGHKKIVALVQLLGRAVATDPADLPKDGEVYTAAWDAADGDAAAGAKEFNSAAVSEMMWEQWRTSVVKHGLGKELLGRFAPRLRDVTKVIWTMPLDTYTGCTLDELRKLKTHGEKRVRAILEIFHAVHRIVAGMGSQAHLVVRIVPRRIDQVERWIVQTLQTTAPPDEKTVFENFTGPLLEQIHDDATEQIAELTDVRLGVARDGAPRSMISVRQVARDMALTRARVYQLLNEVNEILSVRWPAGRRQVRELHDHLLGHGDKLERSSDWRQFQAALELFYPGARRGAAGGETPDSAGNDDDDDGPEEDHFRFRAENERPVLAARS